MNNNAPTDPVDTLQHVGEGWPSPQSGLSDTQRLNNLGGQLTSLWARVTTLEVDQKSLSEDFRAHLLWGSLIGLLLAMPMTVAFVYLFLKVGLCLPQ